MAAVPVLPAAFTGSLAGKPVADLYDAILSANEDTAGSGVSTLIERVFDRLLPVAVFAHEWELADRSVFARGLALEKRVK